MSKNVTQPSFNPPPLVTQPKFNQQSIDNYPPPPPPKMNNYPPPPPPRFNPPPLLRQSGYNENYIYSSNSREINYIFYFYIFLIIVFILGLIMLGVSYFNLYDLRQNNKNNSQKDAIEKWNKVYFVSMLIVIIPILILTFSVCFKSPLTCMAFAILR